MEIQSFQEKNYLLEQLWEHAKELKAAKDDVIQLEKEMNDVRQTVTEAENASIPVDSAFYSVVGPTPSHMQTEISSLPSETTGFVRAFTGKMKARRIDLKVLEKLYPKAKLEEIGDLNKALSGFLLHYLFLDFENESFQRGGCSVIDPNSRCSSFFSEYSTLVASDPTSVLKNSEAFADFFQRKWLLFMERLMDTLGDEVLVSDLMDGNDELKSSFSFVAFAAWKFHRLAFSFNPPATLIRVGKGTPVKDPYLKLHSYFEDQWSEKDRMTAVTEFMVFPGCKLRSTVFACRVYPELK